MTESYLAPLWISLRTVLAATVLTFFLGIAAARWMAHYSGKFKNLVDGLFLLPMVFIKICSTAITLTFIQILP